MKLLFAAITILLFSCSNKEEAPVKDEYRKFFYPVQKEDRFYVFRDVAKGFDEQIHRIYSVEDSKGKHLIVEMYSDDGRITEAYNYNQETLLLDDHMIVDKEAKKRQAELLKNHLFPLNKDEKTYFASRFPGIMDSTFFLIERQNVPEKGKTATKKVLDKELSTFEMTDYYNFTVFNPFTKQESSRETKMHWYYAEGLGLVEWHDEKKNRHFVLQDILTPLEGMKLIGRTK